MTATTTADPRTEQIQRAADEIHHATCEDCWKPGMPMFCGQPDDGEDFCPDGCTCAPCPLCAELWERHICRGTP